MFILDLLEMYGGVNYDMGEMGNYRIWESCFPDKRRVEIALDIYSGRIFYWEITDKIGRSHGKRGDENRVVLLNNLFDSTFALGKIGYAYLWFNHKTEPCISLYRSLTLPPFTDSIKNEELIGLAIAVWTGSITEGVLKDWLTDHPEVRR